MKLAHSSGRRGASALALVTMAGLLVGLGVAPALTASPAAADLSPAVTSDWTVYHQDPSGSGVDPSGASFTDAGPVWTSPALDGQLYGEPLEDNGLVIAATENDTVYALDLSTGAVVWSTSVGTPVPASSLPCGDITPTVGITSTPVIDPSLSEVFVVADELTSDGNASHHLVGLDLATGSVLLDQIVDPPGSFPRFQLQRPGLALDDGQVVIAYGGNAGDCEGPATPYHGWVVAVPEAGGSLTSYEVANEPNDSQGAIWMGGAAPVIDGAGNIWVATGNSAYFSSTLPYDEGDGVLELSPSLALKQYFAPSTWASDNAHDYDLGSVAPVLLGNGMVFQAGKSQTAYLMSQSDLGGVGGQLALKSPFCGGVVDGGSAVVGDIVYSPCHNGIVASQVSTSPPGITVLWRSATGSTGPPIVAGGLIWTEDTDLGILFGLNPANGQPVEDLPVGAIATHFPTPSVADGLMLAPSADQIHAFAGGNANNPPGNLTLYRSTGLVGNLIDRVGGTGWNSNGDGYVNIYQCATPTYAASSCTDLLATAGVRITPSTAFGQVALTPFKVAVGTIDSNGDTCGLSTSGSCYVVVVGSNGDSNDLQLHFAVPAAVMHKPTLVVGNYHDAVTAVHFPIGDIVSAQLCDSSVNPASPGSNCDTATTIMGHAGVLGTVTFSATVVAKVGADYADGAAGTCNPGTTCYVVVTDVSNPAIFVKAPISFATPTVTISPISVPNANGEAIGVTAKNFPIGEPVDAFECDTAYTAGDLTHCDSATQIAGVANYTGTVMGIAWSPVRLPVYTTATSTVYSDAAAGTCSPGDTVAASDPCHIGTVDPSNAFFAKATPFGVT